MKTRLVIATAMLLASISAVASECSHEFASGEAPKVINQPLARNTTVICNIEYAVLYSGVTLTPLWSAEHLTANQIEQARHLKRNDDFHPDSHLAYGQRSELNDYIGSKKKYSIDRGHMAPSGDFSSEASQDQSFSLANVVPQSSENNENLWEGIESAVRTLAVDKGELYVITGPIYKTSDNPLLHDRVMIPKQLYKIVYDPNANEAAAYLADNIATSDYKVISISELENITGIDFFPLMSSSIKKRAMRLPAPTPHGQKNGFEHAGEGNGHREEYHAATWMAERVARHMFYSGHHYY